MLDNNNSKNNVFSKFQSADKKKKKGNVSSRSLKPSESTFMGLAAAKDINQGKRQSKDIQSSFNFNLTPTNKNTNMNQDRSSADKNLNFEDAKEERYKLARSSTGVQQAQQKQTNDTNLEHLISNTLPDTFNVSNVFKRKDETCNFCQKQLGFLKRARHNCNKCGACVCEKCSENKIQLSKKDQQKYRVCNMCFSITQNKPIIIFYKDLESAKDQRVKALSTKKLQYKETLLDDEKEIRGIKRELEEQKKQAEEELENLAQELRMLKQEQVNKKEGNKTFNQLLKTEEINILKKLQEVSEMENQWQILRTQQQNLEDNINDLTNEVSQFLFQCMKYEKNTNNLMQNDQAQNEIRRITFKYEEEKKKNALKNNIKMKQEKLVPNKNNIIFETSAENELSAFGESIDERLTTKFQKPE